MRQASARPRPGFSLIELIVVLAITATLAGLLFPVMARARERVNRVMSANNLRMLGLGFTQYDADTNGRLPESKLLAQGGSPADLTRLYDSTFIVDQFGVQTTGWDGLGLLFGLGYVSMPDVFYAPNHVGLAEFERYGDSFWDPGAQKIYGSYHYGGDMDWETGARRTVNSANLVLASEGFRSLSGLTHRDGLNLLHGDGSVRWFHLDTTFLAQLTLPGESPAEVADRYRPLWRAIEGGNGFGVGDIGGGPNGFGQPGLP
ncbi:MAG: type II secretion system protein [Phycisphaerales bacterium]